MALFLTSDENFTDEINSRTKFSNEIHEDFYKDGEFNLALKEIFFDATFPTIVDHGYPHIITLIRGKEHNIREFPLEFRNDSLFQSMFQNSKTQERRPNMFMSREFTSLSFLSQIDYNVLVEIHPRLNFAISVAYVKDVTIDSKEEMVEFLNRTMFPFHVVKPIKITASGVINIESNLNIFMSQNIFNLLGFNSFVLSEYFEEIDLPSNDLVKKLSADIDDENENLQLVYTDNLERVEKTSTIYNNYRQLSDDKPKGNIDVHFQVDGQNEYFKIEFELDIFNQKNLLISYRDVLKKINLLSLNVFLTSMKKCVLNSGIPYNDEDVNELDSMISYLLENRNSIGLREWGGLFSLRLSRGNVKFVIFHTEKNKEAGQKILKKLESQTESVLIKKAFRYIFLEAKLRKVIFDETLCNLLGIERIDKVRLKHLSIYPNEEIKFTASIDYFKCVNYELAKSYQNRVPYELKLLLSHDIITPKNDGPLKVFKTASDSMFLFRKKRTHVADGYFNNQVNFPNLVFVEANFIQHSLYGSNQKKILNFFPLANKKGKTTHHKFKYPLVLKSVPGNLFHIKLLNENFKSLKADVGVPTLLMLERTTKEDMFPVTIYSSDKGNLALFPDNKACHFKNKLSFPLLFSERDKWAVSLQSIVFPKVQNILPKVCKLYLENPDDNKITHEISVDKCHVKSIENVIFLLNQKIKETLRNFLPAKKPHFSMVNNNIQLETKMFDCFFEPDMMKMLGFSYSYQTGNTKFPSKTVFKGVTKPNIFIFQHQEMVIISNIVEESFYAQSRPTILKIISIPDQQEVTGCNYIQFDNHDGVKIKYDRVDDIEVKLLTRKGDLIDFVDEGDVKLQLEFKKIG